MKGCVNERSQFEYGSILHILALAAVLQYTIDMKWKNLDHEGRLQRDLSPLGIPNLHLVGGVRYEKAQPPMKAHRHEGIIEIRYVARGVRTYLVDDTAYHVPGDHVFITYPDEEHGSGRFPEGKSLVYWLLIDLKSHKGNFLGMRDTEAERLRNALSTIKPRIFKGTARLKDIIESIIESYASIDPFKRVRIRMLAYDFILTVIGCAGKADIEASKAMQGVCDHIREHVLDDVNVAACASECALSVSRFKTRFTKEIGIPPHEYILREKIARAKEMLRAKRFGIADIGYELGFSSSQYFSIVFKRFTGATPAVFRAGARTQETPKNDSRKT